MNVQPNTYSPLSPTLNNQNYDRISHIPSWHASSYADPNYAQHHVYPSNSNAQQYGSNNQYIGHFPHPQYATRPMNPQYAPTVQERSTHVDNTLNDRQPDKGGSKLIS